MNLFFFFSQLVRKQLNTRLALSYGWLDLAHTVVLNQTVIEMQVL